MSRRAFGTQYFARRPAKVSGVCAYIAHRMNWDVIVVRVVTLISFFVAPGISLLSYFISAWLIPSEGK